MSSSCIWCGSQSFSKSIEHVLPDALGCPPSFVLTDCVCRPCNNGLAGIDQALLKQFEIMTFVKGVRRKKGRPPSVEAWPSLRGRSTSGGPELFVNAGRGEIDAWGKTLRPSRASNGITETAFERNGEHTTIKFTQTFGNDPKFVRALYKVAISSLAFHSGSELVCNPLFDAARQFVLNGSGRFEVLMFTRGEPTVHEFPPPRSYGDGACWLVSFKIFGIEFVADLDERQQALGKLTSALVMQANRGWTKLPLRNG